MREEGHIAVGLQDIELRHHTKAGALLTTVVSTRRSLAGISMWHC